MQGRSTLIWHGLRKIWEYNIIILIRGKREHGMKGLLVSQHIGLEHIETDRCGLLWDTDQYMAGNLQRRWAWTPEEVHRLKYIFCHELPPSSFIEERWHPGWKVDRWEPCSAHTWSLRPRVSSRSESWTYRVSDLRVTSSHCVTIMLMANFIVSHKRNTLVHRTKHLSGHPPGTRAWSGI